MAKFRYVQWLVTFLESIDHVVFEWDSGNSLKSENKHGVTTQQIESCFFNEKILPLGIQVEPKKDEDRYGIIGVDNTGKILFICFTVRLNKIRPVSGRIANIKERELYEA